MPPDPNVVLRERPTRGRREREAGGTGLPAGRSSAVVGLSIVAVVILVAPWAQRWLYSGTAVESLLIIYGCATRHRVFRSVPLWLTLASLNLLYAIASTSWTLYRCFATLCYPCVLLTGLIVFPSGSHYIRSGLRSLLKHSRIAKDKIAFSNFPALELDGSITGLLVVRGLTICFSTLTIEAHGIEIGEQRPSILYQ